MARQTLGEMNGWWLRVFKAAHVCVALMMPVVLWCGSRIVNVLDAHDRRIAEVEKRMAAVPENLIPAPDLRRELEDIKGSQRELAIAVHRLDVKVTELSARGQGSQ